jgi:glutaminyl-tRNA synthetase
VRLRGAYLVTCNEAVKDADGSIIELHCTHDPESRGGNAPDGRKVRSTIHWVSAKYGNEAEIRLYDRLFTSENPAAEDGDFKEYLNPDSLKIVTGVIEPGLAEADAGDRFQFERIGYFCADSETPVDKPVFNLTVGLRDSWKG